MNNATGVEICDTTQKRLKPSLRFGFPNLDWDESGKVLPVIWVRETESQAEDPPT